VRLAWQSSRALVPNLSSVLLDAHGNQGSLVIIVQFDLHGRPDPRLVFKTFKSYLTVLVLSFVLSNQAFLVQLWFKESSMCPRLTVCF